MTSQDSEPQTLDVKTLRELAHKEMEIANLMGPSDDNEEAWLHFTEDLVGICDDYLRKVK